MYQNWLVVDDEQLNKLRRTVKEHKDTIDELILLKDNILATANVAEVLALKEEIIIINEKDGRVRCLVSERSHRNF